MKFGLSSTVSNSETVLSAEGDAHVDGIPPVNELRIDTVVQSLSPARIAVAGCIAFDEYIGQEVVLNSSIPRMAQSAIAEFFGGRGVSATPVSDVPGPVWPSAGTLYVESFDSFLVPPVTVAGDAHDFYVQIADGALFNGALSSAHQLILASNAATIAHMRSSTLSNAGLDIALGVLLSQDLHVRGIHVSSAHGLTYLDRCQKLLRAVELNLSWGGRGAEGVV